MNGKREGRREGSKRNGRSGDCFVYKHIHIYLEAEAKRTKKECLSQGSSDCSYEARFGIRKREGEDSCKGGREVILVEGLQD